MTATQTAAKALHLLISEGRTPNEQNIPPYAQQAGKQTDRCPYPLFTLDFYTVPYVYAHSGIWTLGAMGDQRMAGDRIPRIQRCRYAINNMQLPEGRLVYGFHRFELLSEARCTDRWFDFRSGTYIIGYAVHLRLQYIIYAGMSSCGGDVCQPYTAFID